MTASDQHLQIKQRQPWADLCRVLMTFGIIMLHACGPMFYQFGKIPDGEWLGINILDSLVRCAVPVFVMLSGALLLKPDAKPSTIIEVMARVRKLLIPLLVWNTAYLLHASYRTGEPANWLSMLTDAPVYHLWFVYMIVGIYFLLPVLQSVFQAIATRHDLQFYLLVFWLLVTSIPTYHPLPLFALLQQTSLFGYGGYFLIGGIIALSKKSPIPTPLWTALYIASAAVTFSLTLYFSERAHAANESAYVYFSPNVFSSAIAAFILMSRINVSQNLAGPLQWLSERSFLIYVVHVVILAHISKRISAFDPGLPAFMSVLVASIATFIVSLAIASGIRLVPGSKTVLG